MRWLWLLVFASCASEPVPAGPPKQIGGVTVSGETLRDGAKIFSFRCVTCHGPQGDGNGPTGRAQNPKPRDFRLGLIKFCSVKAGELCTDADYARIVTRGLTGTNMLALPLEPAEVDAVTQYVKQLSPKWLDPTAKAGTPIEQSQDPWSDTAAAVAKGKTLVQAHCASCHATADNEGTGSDSVYGFLKAPKLAKGLTLKAGATRSDIYRVIAAGVGGTAMTAQKGVLSEEELWALVHFVEAQTH